MFLRPFLWILTKVQLLLPCLAHSFPPSLLPSFFCLPCIRPFCSTTNRSQHQLFYTIMINYVCKVSKVWGIHGDSLKRQSTRGGHVSTKITGSGSPQAPQVGPLTHPWQSKSLLLRNLHWALCSRIAPTNQTQMAELTEIRSRPWSNFSPKLKL